MLPAAGFGMQAAVCAAPAVTGSGCAAGVCVPKGPVGYGPTACVFSAGDVACPGAPYVNKTVVYGGIDDQRGCSACACGAPAGATCKTGIQVYLGGVPGCMGFSQTFPADGSCNTVSGQFAGFTGVQEGAPMGGACAPSGGQPSGQATGAQPTTVCCA
jgi:hypothetical protein